MAYRLKWLLVRNWHVSLAILAGWFVYAALRDGPSIHYDFLGLSIPRDGSGERIPPWIAVFIVEGILVAWYLLPSRRYCRWIRLFAGFSGAWGLAALLIFPAIFSQPIHLGLDLAIGVYIFTSVLIYAIVWPSELAI